MKYMIDIDDTICQTEGSDYTNSRPIKHRIEHLNRLYDQGHEMHYWTARGGRTGIDWADLTKEQLTNWGVKYTTVKTGKPVYDVWIDDKAINADEYFK